MTLLDLRRLPDVIDLLNKELSAGNIVEVKVERDNVTVIRIDRKVKVKAQFACDKKADCLK